MGVFKLKNRKLMMGALAFAIVGSNCTPPAPIATKPELEALPTAISFSACPTKDETGGAVTDVFPDIKKLTVNNKGRVGTDVTFAFTGAGASAFSIDGTVPTTIDRLGSLELPLKFSPTARGDVRADFNIDDGVEDTPNPIVTLIGSGINLPSQPSIETAPQKTDKSGFMTCTSETPLSDCTLEFPDTLMDQTNTLQLKIKNKGCPALKITALNIEGQTAGTTDGFEITTPAAKPSTGSPLVLSTADGTDETIITVTFTATDDGTGAPSQSRYASLIIESNDPNFGDGFQNPSRLTLQANAVKPSIYVSPTSCNYTNAQDNCGNTPRVDHKASFRVTNDGATPVLLSGVSFASSGTTTSANSRFTITQNVQGTTLQPTQSATLEVTETDAPLLVSDQIQIIADIVGQGAGSGGNITLSVISGIKPCLTSDPLDNIDFGDPADELTGRRLLIKNGAGCGQLVLSEVSIAPSPFYTLVDPPITPGTIVPPGGQAETNVQYKRPSTGGMQLGELRIKSNDTDFGAPQYKLIILQSNAAADTFPTAALTACKPSDLINDSECAAGQSVSASFNLSMVPAGEITLSAVNSTDTAPGVVSEYRFTVITTQVSPLPAGASVNDLDGNGVRAAISKRKLTIPAGVTGNYRIGLTVWDNRGQQSANMSTITIIVYP